MVHHNLQDVTYRTCTCWLIGCFTYSSCLLDNIKWPLRNSHDADKVAAFSLNSAVWIHYPCLLGMQLEHKRYFKLISHYLCSITDWGATTTRKRTSVIKKNTSITDESGHLKKCVYLYAFMYFYLSYFISLCMWNGIKFNTVLFCLLPNARHQTSTLGFHLFHSYNQQLCPCHPPSHNLKKWPLNIVIVSPEVLMETLHKISCSTTFLYTLYTACNMHSTHLNLYL